MKKKKVLISVGPIPARLDSVKFITNRFKGGLAIKTAEYLLDKGYEVTAIMWKHTDSSGLDIDEMCRVIKVVDVVEYYDWIKSHALDFDAFIMAAAVANLMPSNPIEGKFPSHLYKVGEKFNVEFEIAPRAIDVIKQVNPRCCLIGYKLFDAKSDEELIEIARHTLKDSKANVIFANTPAEAKTRKIALFQDDTSIECTFEQHLKLICDAIDSEYFTTTIDTNIYDDIDKNTLNKINMCKEIVKKFENTLTEKHGNKYGTIAIKVSDIGDFVTTSRGHNGEPVYVKNIDIENKKVIADGKATLNAPALKIFLDNNFDYVIHKHEEFEWDSQKCVGFADYVFPGTVVECNMTQKVFKVSKHADCIYEMEHGYIKGYKLNRLDWDRYYELFGVKYNKYPDEIKELIDNTDKREWLDVGCNRDTDAEIILDTNIDIETKKNLKYEENHENEFKLITLKNSINYLTKDEISTLMTWIKKDGVLIANSFASNPDFRVKDNEAVYKDKNKINHYLIKSESEVYMHNFNTTNLNWFKEKGFDIKYYNDNKSVILKYVAK